MLRLARALVIGIDNYPEPYRLNVCVNGANAMRDVLQFHGDGSSNFDVKSIMCDNDYVSPSCNRTTVRDTIVELFEGEPDITLLYFSGHGLTTNIDGYLVMPDFNRYGNDGISMRDILTWANQSKAKDKVIILDCCHAGAISEKSGALIAAGVSVLTACGPAEKAREGEDGLSIFSSLVIGALKGGAADLRGNITTGSIYAYVDQALGAFGQRPTFMTNVSRFTPLRQVRPSIAEETLRRLTKHFPKPLEEHLLDPSYEFTEPNHDVTNVTVFKDLQKFERVGLVVPVGEEHMYFAAINSKCCKLTPLGHHYWRLVKDKRI